MISRDAVVSTSSRSEPLRSAPKNSAVAMVPMRTAVGQQRRDHAVEAETGSETLHEAVVHAERLDAAGQPADRPGRQQHA